MINKINFKIIIIFAILIILIIQYILQVLSTNQLIHYVEDIFCGKVSASETQGTPVDKYNFSKDIEFDTVDIDITRVFVAHGFSDGYMIVYYKCQAFDACGNTVYGAATIFPQSPSIWKIHKENGVWKIVEIHENP